MAIKMIYNRLNKIGYQNLVIAFFGVIIIFVTSCNKENFSNSLYTDCETSAVFNPEKDYGVLIDQEGNVYKTIQIGSQTWMAENLRTTIYRNGEKIPQVKDPAIWISLNSGAYCNYNNTIDEDTVCTYGRLYNWYAVADDRNIAPEGWHVPSIEEWLVLEEYLEPDTTVAQKLSETGGTHWPPFWDSYFTNETGYTALPGGYRPGIFDSMGEFGYWWTSSEGEAIDDNAWHFHISDCSFWTGRCECPKKYGKSIRCVKD